MIEYFVSFAEVFDKYAFLQKHLLRYCWRKNNKQCVAL